MNIEKKRLLESSAHVLKLVESDPRNPLNRSTPYEQIGNRLESKTFPVADFRFMVRELKAMSAEGMPEAKTALDNMRAHFASRLQEIGGKHSGQWNNRGVNKFLADNDLKMRELFSSEQELRLLADLRAGGNILKVDGSYPGAAAQAAKAMKQGLGSHLIQTALTSAGGAAGSILGPAGAAAGSFLGRMAGNKAAVATGESAALKKVGKRMTALSEIGKP